MIKFLKSQPVLSIAFLVAVISMFAVPPDSKYTGYVNKTVLIQLFSLMTAVAGLKSIGIFEKITGFILKKAGNVRKLSLILTVMCYVSSMFVTNDVALITFIPLTLMIFENIRDEKSRILTIVLETAGANLGSMLTPVGNPQNLYIYDTYGLTAGIFLKTMLPTGILSLILLILLTFLLPEQKCSAYKSEEQEIPVKKAVGYSILFAVCLLTVFRVIPDWLCLISAVATALVLDRELLKKADYPLLLTFVCFFVFVGNIARIETVKNFFSSILEGHELIVSVILSQAISNVPASVMLSGFTQNGTQLMLGVNIGGLGTLIASLASLISFQFYRNSADSDSGRYIKVFSIVNFGMLIPLLLINII